MPEHVAEVLNVSPSRNQDAIAVECLDVSRDFGNVRALRKIDLDVTPGTIHALVGQNGAGKSTLLGIIAGRITPTKGAVRLFGEELPYGNPRQIRGMGVATIYQELMVVPTLSALANVYLGQPISRSGLLMEGEMRRGFTGLCERITESIPPDAPAGSLSVAQQQLLEIMRGLVASARLMLFDEPTASLPPHDREALFRVMAELRSSGVTIMFVSHNLDEVLRVADVVTVFRDGRLAASAPAGDWTKSSLVETMLGRALEKQQSRRATGDRQTSRAATDTPLLRVEGLNVHPHISGINFQVCPGEILGLGGLMGSGRTTILRALAGLEPDAKGRLWVNGKEVPWPHTARRARSLGIALLPEDRKGQGLVLTMSAADNVVLSDLGSVATAGVISRQKTMGRAKAASSAFGIDDERLPELSANLSGGNQQKLLFARWKHRPPRLLLADEPTRGVDVGAKAEILDALRSLAAEGKGIVFVSSELEEVADTCRRVLVLAEGRQVAEVEGGRGDATVQDILSNAFRVEASGG